MATINSTRGSTSDEDDFLFKIPSNKESRAKSLLTERYNKACKIADTFALSTVTKQLCQKCISLANQRVGPKVAKAISITLVRETHTTELDLKDNGIGPYGTKCISDMLMKNFTLRDLDLSENEMGMEGLSSLVSALRENTSIRKLNISGNQLNDEAAPHFADLIQNSLSIIELIANHNSFAEEGGTFIGAALEQNDILEILDLSWNNLRGKGACAISCALKKNTTLRILNISWNGFTSDSLRCLSNVLKENRTLEELDITNNRLSTTSALLVVNALLENTTLEVLRMGKNPMGKDLPPVFLKMLDQHRNSAIKTLDFTDVIVENRFVEALAELKQKRDIEVIHGPVIRDGDCVGKRDNGIDWRNPINTLFNYMYESGYRVLDLMKRLDQDGSMSVDREEFKRGLNGLSVPLTEDQLDKVLDQLDKDGDGEVDFKELMEGEKEFGKRRNRKKFGTIDANKRGVPARTFLDKA